VSSAERITDGAAIPLDTAREPLGIMNGFDVVVAVGVVGSSSSSLSSFSSSLFTCIPTDGTSSALDDSCSDAVFSSCTAMSSLSRLFS